MEKSFLRKNISFFAAAARPEAPPNCRRATARCCSRTSSISGTCDSCFFHRKKCSDPADIYSRCGHVGMGLRRARGRGSPRRPPRRWRPLEHRRCHRGHGRRRPCAHRHRRLFPQVGRSPHPPHLSHPRRSAESAPLPRFRHNVRSQRDFHLSRAPSQPHQRLSPRRTQSPISCKPPSRRCGRRRHT